MKSNKFGIVLHSCFFPIILTELLTMVFMGCLPVTLLQVLNVKNVGI